ncbi:MAG: hypothetical protein P4L92_16500 [Rudaea sp.]|nr:hypothetical protein [Rudaea sp.]
MVGYVDDEPGFSLPAIFEGLADISYARAELLQGRALFLKYLVDTSVRYLITPNAGHAAASDSTIHISPMIANLSRELAENPAVHSITDSSYDMYDVSGLSELDLTPQAAAE